MVINSGFKLLRISTISPRIIIVDNGLVALYSFSMHE